MIEPLVTTATLLGAGLAAAAAGLVWQIRAAQGLRRRNATLEGQHTSLSKRCQDLDAELGHLVQARLPALVESTARGHRGVVVPGLRSADLQGSQAADDHQAVLDLCAEAVTLTRDQIGLAARSSVRDIVDEAQPFLVRCQMKAVEEMDRYPEGTAYHQSLMDLDHLVTRAIHTLQRTRILTGSWPGLQRADCTFREIVESARGRIDAYRRVAYAYEPGTGESWVEGRVVEPVTVALTELLSNATAYSQGEVRVQVQQIQTGYCVLVDDSGLNMNASQRDQAARLLAQTTVLDVTTLPDTLHLGFPVIGRLAGEYGFAVDVSSTSPYGGVRAVLRVPRELLGHGPTDEEREAERRAAKPAPAPVAAAPAPTPAPRQEAPPRSAPESGNPALPQRRRRQPRSTEAPVPVSEAAPQEDPDTFSQGFANLTAAIREGEADHTEGDRSK